MPQVGDKVRVLALRLAGLIGNFCHRLTGASGHLQHHVHGRDAGYVGGQVGADAKADIDAPTQRPKDIECLGQVQPVGEHQRLAHRVDTQFLVVRDAFFGPLHRVARIMAQTVEQLGEVQIEVVQEGIGGDAVSQRNTQQTAILANPAIERGDLAVDQARPQLLVSHDPFVGHRTEWLEVKLARQMHIAGADQLPRKVLLEHVENFFLHTVGKPSARAEVRDFQLGQLIWRGVDGQPFELVVQAIPRLAEQGVRVAMSIAHLADDRQQRHFKEDDVEPRAVQANAQFIVLDAGFHIAGIETEQAQKSQKIRFHEGDAFQKDQVLRAQGQLAQQLDLVLDFAQIGTQVFTVAAAKLPFNVDVGVVVQHCLHHGQFVKIGIEQALHDAI